MTAYRAPAQTDSPESPKPPPRPTRKPGLGCIGGGLLLTAAVWVVLKASILTCIGGPIACFDLSEGPLGYVPYAMLFFIGVAAILRTVRFDPR